MSSFLDEVLKKTDSISSSFQEEFNKVLGDGIQQKNEPLAVFYREDILRAFENLNTPIKIDKDMFYVWNSKYWSSIEDSRIKRFIGAYIKKRGLLFHTSSAIIEGVFKNLKIELGGFIYKRNNSSQFINLSNGILVIDKSGLTFEMHNENYHLDYILDFNYDDKSSNERWLKFLDEVIPNKDTQKSLQQVIGNLLIRGLKIEVLPFLYGTGGNGKSVVLEVLTGLFGRNNITTYSLTKITTDEKIRARLADGKIMNLSSENNMGNVNADVAKNYSSCEPLDARLNYGNPFEVYDYAKFLGNVNKLNVMDGERTQAIARRQIIVPFTKTISLDKMDINLHNKILENKSGVLNWIIEGIKEVVKNEKIYQSKEVKNLLKKYQEETNPIAQMVKEYSYNILSEGTTSRVNYVTLTDIYKEYTDFTSEIGVGKLSRQNFKSDLLAIKGIKEYKYNNKICFNLSTEYSSTIKVEFEDKNGVIEKTEELKKSFKQPMIKGNPIIKNNGMIEVDGEELF